MIVDEAGTGEWSGWAGATGANPEVTFVDNDVANVPDGTYYLELDPWSVDTPIVNFTVTLGFPDGAVSTFDFTWDVANEANYPFGWGYQLVKIVKAGSSYTVTAMPGY